MKKILCAFYTVLACGTQVFAGTHFSDIDVIDFRQLSTHSHPTVGETYYMGSHTVNTCDLNDKRITGGWLYFKLTDMAAEQLAEQYGNFKAVTSNVDEHFLRSTQTGDTLEIYARIVETSESTLNIYTQIKTHINNEYVLVFDANFQFVHVKVDYSCDRIKVTRTKLSDSLQNRKTNTVYAPSNTGPVPPLIIGPAHHL